MGFGLGFLMNAIKPYLNKLGNAMYDLDKSYEAKDVCIVITKRKNDKGETRTFMGFIERPEDLGKMYLKDKDGKPALMGIEGLGKLIGSDNEDDE